jgi:hypothetical protein
MIIAERIVMLREAAIDRAVPIRIFAPRAEPEGHWTCRYEIGWPHGVKAHDVGGVDAVQALLLALSTVGVELYTSDAHKEGRLRFERESSGYGFPVLAGLRDLLEGDDRKFF